MAARGEQHNRNEAFGRLLSGAVNSIATYEGKTTPTVEDELGVLAVVSGKTIQRYKAGHIPPELRTVDILAEAAVKRGFLGRAWLQRFLHAARYPGADQLLDRLCPAPIVRPRAPQVYANLPAPTYSQFVMRAQAFADVCEGLTARSAAVLIVGLGGQGKTSLAREVADACLKGAEGAPQFDAAVWVSDKDRPGTTNLSTVLDEIARTLDYPGFTQFEHDEKRREVEQLLRKQRVLLIVDNFETVTDGALLSWLLRLPEPSKALITSREYQREYRRGGWPVELRGMTEDEAQQLVEERARVLKISVLGGDKNQLEQLIAATGGNPKAIGISLGLLKYERRPLQQVVDDLYAARGELFDDLFARAWSLLDEAARRVLMVITFFPDSASGEAVAASADVRGYAFDRAVERLTDLALLDIQQADLSSTPRYTLHPLVRVFANARLAEQPNFEHSARERWIEWFVSLATTVGFCWNDLDRLQILDAERQALFSIDRWASENNRSPQLLRLAYGVRYYYDVRGFWSEIEWIDRICIEAAKQSDDLEAEVAALASLVRRLCHQGNLIQAEELFPRLQGLVELRKWSDSTFIECQDALFLYWRVHHNLVSAKNICYDLINNKNTPVYGMIAARHWLAGCLYKEGRLVDSEILYHEILEQAGKQKYQRSVIFALARLITINLDQNKIIEAEQKLSDLTSMLEKYQDSRYIARSKLLFARKCKMQGRISEARVALEEAIELYERLGVRGETEAHSMLSEL